MNKLALGNFVTAEIIGAHATRQGAIAEVIDDDTIIVQGEDGERYRCKTNVMVVPDTALWGSARAFVQKFRALLN